MIEQPKHQPKDKQKKEIRKKLKRLLCLALVLISLNFANQHTAPYDPITGERNFSDTVLGEILKKSLNQIYKELEVDPEANELIHRIIQASNRLPQNPTETFIDYFEKTRGDYLSKPFPDDLPFTNAFQKIATAEGKPDWIPPEIIITEYTDSTNRGKVQIASFKLKEWTPKLLLPEQMTGRSASPNIYLAVPDPDQRRKGDLFQIGTNPFTAHTNAAAIALTIDGTQITFGFGWNKPRPELEEEYKGSPLYYGDITPNNDAIPATGIFEIRNGKIITYSEYEGDLDNPDSPPVFMYLGNNKITIIRGEELQKILDKPPYDGLIIQIATAEQLNNDFIDITNQIRILIEKVKKPNLYSLRDFDLIIQTIINLTNEIEHKLHNDYKYTKDAVWMILIETEDGAQSVSLAVKDAMSGKTPASYLITAAIIEALGNTNGQIKSIQLIGTGANGSTANIIFTPSKQTNTGEITNNQSPKFKEQNIDKNGIEKTQTKGFQDIKKPRIIGGRIRK
ncbi:MAG: hypothetical protein KatS3mg090_1010 [Patescibacteria group bacterium]|nr:MAG: hypothetical protein KatS3mg090_1010 [Patescibacteria group bacterium]